MSEFTFSSSRFAESDASAVRDRRAAVTSIAVLTLTALHHAYGAIVYDTPWRMQVAYYAVIGAVLIGGLFYLGRKSRHRAVGAVLRWTAIVIAAAFPIAFIGLFEGAYNHILKNILYFGGLPTEVFRQMFPAPVYELPNDLFFEVTGCGHFVIALVAAFALVSAIRGSASRVGQP